MTSQTQGASAQPQRGTLRAHQAVHPGASAGCQQKHSSTVSKAAKVSGRMTATVHCRSNKFNFSAAMRWRRHGAPSRRRQSTPWRLRPLAVSADGARPESRGNCPPGKSANRLPSASLKGCSEGQGKAVGRRSHLGATVSNGNSHPTRSVSPTVCKPSVSTTGVASIFQARYPKIRMIDDTRRHAACSLFGRGQPYIPA